MKRLVLFIMILGIGVSLFAQIPQHRFASGKWNFAGDRLHQSDAGARLAKANFNIPQSGPMIYEFNVRYEDGIDDGHGGFGLHVFADDIYHGTSWGSGVSYLLWLNYDEKPITPGIPKGFSAQVYRSYSSSRMDLVESFDLNEYAHLLTYENCAANTVPGKIYVNGDTGEVRVYDPTDPDLEDYFYFYLPTKGLRGDWVSLRTNGIELSFEMGL